MRGRVTFTVAGQEHALQFTSNRLCQLEADAGEGLISLVHKLEDPENIRITDIRVMFRAGLVGEFTLEEAGDIIDEIGTQDAMVLLGKAFGAAFEGSASGTAAGKQRAGRV